VKLCLDTSSLVKLFIAETGSEAVRELVTKTDTVCTSPVAYAETRATFARLRRAGQLDASAFASAKREFEVYWPTYLTVNVTDSLCREAGGLAEQFGLRGFDGIHLASFAQVAREAGIEETSFSSFDDRLNEAARRLRRILARRGR
jgi:predicted nucleic acid-binding protein